MAIMSIVVCLLVLIILIARWHFNPFVAFLIASVSGALLLGIPPEKIPLTLKTGMGGHDGDQCA